MIVFDLACGAGHVFEAWFGSSEDYEAQRARGLVSCPVCDSPEVGKAVMAPRVGPKGNSGTLAPAQAKAMLAELARVQGRMLEGSEHVGDRFADEARAIHLGDADARTIHGRASASEVRALVEEGVPVAPLPLPVRPATPDN